MTDSTLVLDLKRIERMASYAQALGNFCDEFYDATEPYTPHGDCPFWTGSVCVLQTVHPSDWDTLEVVQTNKIDEP